MDVVIDGDSEHAIVNDTDVALRAIQNLERKESLADYSALRSWRKISRGILSTLKSKMPGRIINETSG